MYFFFFFVFFVFLLCCGVVCVGGWVGGGGGWGGVGWVGVGGGGGGGLDVCVIVWVCVHGWYVLCVDVRVVGCVCMLACITRQGQDVVG